MYLHSENALFWLIVFPQLYFQVSKIQLEPTHSQGSYPSFKLFCLIGEPHEGIVC